MSSLTKNVKFIAKTRSDCRIYNPDFISYCKNLLFLYKSTKLTNYRIISSDLSSVKTRPYSLGDIFQFGDISDMTKFWSYKGWIEDLKIYFDGKKVINFTPIVGEIFLTCRYLINIGLEINFTLEDWWRQLKNHFIIIDSSSIGHLFYKYDPEFFDNNHMYFAKHHKHISHIDWIQIYHNQISGWIDKYDGLTQEKFEITKDNRIRKLRDRS